VIARGISIAGINKHDSRGGLVAPDRRGDRVIPVRRPAVTSLWDDTNDQRDVRPALWTGHYKPQPTNQGVHVGHLTTSRTRAGMLAIALLSGQAAPSLAGQSTTATITEYKTGIALGARPSEIRADQNQGLRDTP
jgi:hypothetical protein